MSPPEAIALLQIHAAGTVDASGNGVADVLWRYRASGGNEPRAISHVDLAPAWEEVVQALEALVEVARTWAEAGVPLAATYAVAEIMASTLARTAGQAPDQDRCALELFAWGVACAWEAVLAGDVEDLREHVEGEAWGRDIALPW